MLGTNCYSLDVLFLFTALLTYKLESAGREIAWVDPVYMSKCCLNCGMLFENLTLSNRWVRCDRGLSLDRDYNAAFNILKGVG